MTSHPGMPVLSLELSGMKHTVLQALTREAALLDTMLREAVDKFCTEGHLRQVVNTTVRDVMNEAVKEEIQRFFRYSRPGRQAIREAVLEHLNERYPEKESE